MSSGQRTCLAARFLVALNENPPSSKPMTNPGLARLGDDTSTTSQVQ
jgi:hypothetical protein